MDKQGFAVAGVGLLYHSLSIDATGAQQDVDLAGLQLLDLQLWRNPRLGHARQLSLRLPQSSWGLSQIDSLLNSCSLLHTLDLTFPGR